MGTSKEQEEGMREILGCFSAQCSLQKQWQTGGGARGVNALGAGLGESSD